MRLHMGNGYSGTSTAGKRVFDVALEGSLLSNLDNVDLSANFGNLVGGMISNTVSVTDGTLNIKFLHGVENPLINGIEILQVGSPGSTVGQATLEITATSDNVQASNFGSNSFSIKNTGDKDITKVEIDVTGALYPDTVFDPFGLAGDSVKKALTINTNGNTGVVGPSTANYIGTGGYSRV